MSIFNFYRKLVSPKLMPVAGEKWSLAPRVDPWGGKDYPPVTILDVKDGWVRYKFGDTVFNDERMELAIFIVIYHKVA